MRTINAKLPERQSAEFLSVFRVSANVWVKGGMISDSLSHAVEGLPSPESKPQPSLSDWTEPGRGKAQHLSSSCHWVVQNVCATGHHIPPVPSRVMGHLRQKRSLMFDFPGAPG